MRAFVWIVVAFYAAIVVIQLILVALETDTRKRTLSTLGIVGNGAMLIWGLNVLGVL